jgi:hypothetical protein
MEDPIYQCPPDEILNKVMKEKKWKKDFRVDLVQMKYEIKQEEMGNFLWGIPLATTHEKNGSWD